MKQAMKLGTETASLSNSLMGRNRKQPVVGKGATILRWTDRNCAEVLEVRNSGKIAILQMYEGDTDKLIESPFEVHYKWGAWRRRSSMHGWSKVNILFGVRDYYYDLEF